MITLSIPLLVGFSIWWFNRKCMDDNVFIAMTILPVFVFLFVHLAVGPFVQEGESKKVEYQIVSLRDSNTSINGGFFLGSGNFRSTEQYVMMRKLEENSFIRVYAPCDETILTESDSQSPTYTVSFERYPFSWIIGPHFLNMPTNRVKQRKVIVPKGTVIINLYEIK